MAIDDVVVVNITVQDAIVSEVGFGTPALLGRTAVIAPDLAREYTTLAGFLADFSPGGVTAATDLENVAAATAIFSQQPSVSKLVFLRQTSAAVAQTHTITPVAATEAGQVYSVTINGETTSYTTVGADSAATIATDLFTNINLGSEPVTAADLTGSLSLTADVAGDTYALRVNDANILNVEADNAAEGVVADVTAAQVENDDWYTLHTVRHLDDETTALATYIETLRKIYIAGSQDFAVLDDNTGVAESLNTSAFNRTGLIYNHEIADHPDAAWAGRVLPDDPGTVTWAHKQLTGVTPSVLTAQQETNIRQYEANTFTTVGGLNLTMFGTAASGRFFDVTRAVDQLHNRVVSRVLTLLANSKKVPYTDGGIAQVESVIRKVLGELVATNVLVGGFTVTVPLAADISAANKASRTLVDVAFAATLAGAIHKVIPITGTISV